MTSLATSAASATASFATALAQPITIWPSDNSVDVDYYYVNSGLTGDFLLPGWTWSLERLLQLVGWRIQRQPDPEGNCRRLELRASFGRPVCWPELQPVQPAFLSGNYSQASL